MDQSPDRAEVLKAEIAALEALLALVAPFEETPGESIGDIIDRMTGDVRDTTVNLAALTGHATIGS